MTLDLADIRDLEDLIGDRLHLQIASWRLYLGDAGLAKDLAIECSATIDQGAVFAATKALESLKVQVAGGKTSLPLILLMPSAQIKVLEEILVPYCR